MQMYMQWIKDNGSTSSFRELIIPCQTRFEKLALSQFKLYIETETTTHCFVCCNFQKTILVRYAEGKEDIFCISHILRIYTGLCKASKTNVYDLHLKKMNTTDISKYCIKISKSEVLSEKYIMALNPDKYDIEV